MLFVTHFKCGDRGEPCWKVFDCWWETFDIVTYMKASLTADQFESLMQTRIVEVLVVCNNYDKFILEEDGRIEEHLFNEYFSIGLLKYINIFFFI